MTVIESETVPRRGVPQFVETVAQRHAVRQFLKFCAVGGMSTVIDFGVFALLDRVVHLPEHFLRLLAGNAAWHAFAERHHVGILIAATISFSLAVTNGFYFNRRWTFAHVVGGDPRRQYVQFVLVNIVGLLLNLAF